MRNSFLDIIHTVRDVKLDHNKVISLVEDYMIMPDQYLFVVSVSEAKIVYQKGIENVLGFDSYSLEDHMTNIHPEDYRYVMHASTFTLKHALEMCYKKPFQSFYSIDYRTKTANNEYVRVLRKTTQLALCDEGKVTYYLTICTDITKVKRSKEISVGFSGEGTDGISKEQILGIENKDLWTSREVEIIDLIMQGFSSKEIANLLSLSYHTIRTHRKNILRKGGFSSTSQLVEFFML